MTSTLDIKTIQEVTDWSDKTVFLRASLNVPVENGVVQNTYRLQHTVPTIAYLTDRGARVLVAGHIGRDPKESLYPVYEALRYFLPVSWGGDHTTDECRDKIDTMAAGSALMLENLRRFPGEKTNDPTFAKQLGALADSYVNDAFANMHRTHASMIGVPEHLPAYAGLRVQAEVAALAAAQTPQAPSLFILGGAKFETKLSLIERYIGVYDEVFVGGALAHDVMRARGYEVGQSLVSDIALTEVPVIADERLVLPLDVVVQKADGTVDTVALDAVEKDDIIYDCGPQTIQYLTKRAQEAGTVLWNGPLGNYETGFTDGTEGVAIAVADSPAATYVGGGDTVAAIQTVERDKDFTFISTGGGAMLAYLEHGSLPGLTPLLRS